MKTFYLFLILSLFSGTVHSQKNRFQCYNEKQVDLYMKSMQYTHFFNLEIKKPNYDPAQSKMYREQAVYYQNLSHDENERCSALPDCTEEYTVPSFNSQQECEEYLRPYEDKKNELEEQIKANRKEVSKLYEEHRYTDAGVINKETNLLCAQVACLKKLINQVNCPMYMTSGETGEFFIDWEMWGIADYISLNIGGFEISKGNEVITITEGENLSISGELKNYNNYLAAGVPYYFHYVVDGNHNNNSSFDLPASGVFQSVVGSFELTPGEHILFVSVTNGPEYGELADFNLGPFTIIVEPGYSPSSSVFDLEGAGWGLKLFDSGQGNVADQVNAVLQNDHSPVGVGFRDISAEGMIFIAGNALGITNWDLQYYTDAESLQNGIASYINAGYLPMGISFTGQGELYVLYVLCDIQASGWQLVESQLNLQYVTGDLEQWINQQYIPVGITVFGGMYYTLVVQLTDAGLSNWYIEGYNDDQNEIQSGINRNISDGMVPFGYLKEGEVVNVLYVGF